MDFIPAIPSWNYMFMLEAMTYKGAIKIPPHYKRFDLKPEDITVQAWTNQIDRHSSEGHWHDLDLALICQDDNDNDKFLYGCSDIITGDRDFNFTFRFKLPGEKDWRWANHYGLDGFAHVEPPRHYDKWTQGPDYTHVLGTLHVGNFIAATNAKECGFTHVLNVADNLDMVYPEGGVSYKKVNKVTCIAFTGPS